MFISFSPMHAAPEGAPANLKSSAITSTSLTLTWLPPQNTLQNGVIRQFLITAVELNTGTNSTYRTQSSRMNSFSLGDLHPSYTYRFNVHAVTIEVGPASLDHVVTLLEDGTSPFYLCFFISRCLGQPTYSHMCGLQFMWTKSTFVC